MCPDLVGRGGAALAAEVPHDREHHGQQDLAPLVVADEQRFALFAETGDVLVGERQFAAEQQDLPRGLEPDEQQRQRCETAVNGIVGGHPPLDVEVSPLEKQEKRAGDDARHQGAPEFDLRIGDDDIQDGEHDPDDDHRRQVREQGEIPAAVEAQHLLGEFANGIGNDPQHRHDHHHGDVVGILAGEAAIDLDLPDVVEGAFDRAEDPDHSPEEHDQRHGGHHAALCAGERLFGERDDVVYDLGVLREEGVEVFHQPVGQPEALDDGEDHRDDRYQRHQRVERECRAADDGAVFEQAPRRIEQQPVLLHEPADHRVAPLADVAPEDRVRKIGEYFADFHKPFPFP